MIVLKALTKFLSSKKKAHVLLWVNLYDNPDLFNDRANVDDLLNLIEIEADSDIRSLIQEDLLVKFKNHSGPINFIPLAESMTTGHEALLDVSKNNLSKLFLSLEPKKGTTISIHRQDFEKSELEKSLFDRKKAQDAKVYLYRIRSKDHKKTWDLDHDTALAKLKESHIDKNYLWARDSLHDVTTLKDYKIESLMEELTTAVYHRTMGEEIKLKLAKSQANNDFHTKPFLKDMRSSIRLILDSDPEKMWDSKDIRKKIDDLYDLTGPLADPKIFNRNFTKAISEIRKKNPDRITKNPNMVRR